jgi:CheY-like chemotaxis protein
MGKNNAKHRVLVVEDDDANRFLISLCLDQLGYKYDLAKNSGEAIEHANNNDYSAILMDIQLRGRDGRDGIETTKYIRSMEIKNDRPHVPIIALTAEGDKELCFEAGMDDYVTKPITTKLLREKLDVNIEEI